MKKLLAIAASVMLLSSVAPHPPRLNAPRLMLWAWERPEDLRFLNPAIAGVAFLAATISISPEGAVRVKSRLQPLRLPPGIAVMQVVRIETPARCVLPSADAIADRVAAIARNAGYSGIQINFDARASERRFYREILTSLRGKTSKWIGVTALASWCTGVDWLSGAPVSEAVPMLFRMGSDEFRDMPLESPMCRSSAGLSTDEPWPLHPKRGRVYVFNPHSWTQPEYQAVAQRVEGWR